MTGIEVKKIIRNEKFIPILRADSTEILMNVSKAVIESGKKILEFTMTIPGILDVIPDIKARYPELVLGIGTVYDPDDAKNAIKNGVDFVVSPILNFDIVDVVKNEDKLLMLAAFTPTEIYNAYKVGSDIIKLFPANHITPKFIKTIKGPMPFVDILPTGGVDIATGIEFLKKGAFAIGLGGVVFKKEWIGSNDLQSVANALREAQNKLDEIG